MAFGFGVGLVATFIVPAFGRDGTIVAQATASEGKDAAAEDELYMATLRLGYRVFLYRSFGATPASLPMGIGPYVVAPQVDAARPPSPVSKRDRARRRTAAVPAKSRHRAANRG